VTEFDPNESGVQLLGLAFTEDALRAEIVRAQNGTGSFDVMTCSELEALIDGLIEEYKREYGYGERPTSPSPRYEPPPYTPPPRYEPPPPPTTVACPKTKPTATVTTVDSTPNPNYGRDDYWEVRVVGTVHNGTPTRVSVYGVAVEIEGYPYGTVRGRTTKYELAPGESMSFEATASMQSESPPSRATAALDTWNWSDYRYSHCGK
jgi:hypothetical protein